jgi:transcriptional regulator with XRE-family HTH domain
VSIDLGYAPAHAGECRATQGEVAALVRRIRETSGLTQRQLAERMGSTQSVVARWETGDHEITMKTLTRIADALGVELVLRYGSQETC